ncbi:hypothetical protein B0H14DRAFT_3692857 [Mycena olivaceomarginata]|nr:hypothetical protein B0H14DRAFT_3692857 [Mycena olivaceomarginata]
MVDNGALRNCMSLARWKQYSHLRGRVLPSKTRLSVANDRRFWWGEVSVGGMSAFACHSRSSSVMGIRQSCSENPGCTAWGVLHNYETDEIRIRSSGRETIQRAQDRQGQTTRGTRAGDDGSQQTREGKEQGRAAHGEAAHTQLTRCTGTTRKAPWRWCTMGHQLQEAQQARSSDEQPKHWTDNLEGGKIGQRESICSTSTTPTRFSRGRRNGCDIGRQRRCGGVLQLEASDQGCETGGAGEGVCWSLKYGYGGLRGKLDEMRRMAAAREAKHRRNRPIFTSPGSQLGIDRSQYYSYVDRAEASSFWLVGKPRKNKKFRVKTSSSSR